MICSSARRRMGRSGTNGNSGSEHDPVVAASALHLAIRSAPQHAAIWLCWLLVATDRSGKGVRVHWFFIEDSPGSSSP